MASRNKHDGPPLAQTINHDKHLLSNTSSFVRLHLDRPRLVRKRQVQACEQCRSRKIKCDQLKPDCLQCSSSSRPCTYRSSAERKRRAQASDDDTPASRRPQLPSNGERQGGQTIRLNQVGHLKATSGVRLRYYSSSSWVAGVEESNVSTSKDDHVINSCFYPPNWISLSSKPPPGPANEFVHFAEVDRLIAWYIKYCHFWFPLVDTAEVINLVQDLRSNKNSPPDSSALIAAICYTAARSSSASGDVESLGPIPSSFWRDVASQLLTGSGYPSQPNLNTIRVAFFLAVPSVAEGKSHPDPSSVSVLVRAAQSLGLHREPLSFHLSTNEVELNRIIWWSIRGLDTTYAIAHALPPLIHSTTTDVRLVDCGERLERKLLNTITRTSLLISRTLHDIYGVSQPTLRDIQQLDEEAGKIYAEEAPHDSQYSEFPAVERFVAMSRMMCCCKMIFILHQPYLRTVQWPRSSRSKALNACQNYIGSFVTGVTDQTLAPYRWVLGHFDVIHACTIVLQDLILHPGFPESIALRGVVETCFSTFSSRSHPDWSRLEALRAKAWTANRWHVDTWADLDLLQTGLNLADWDPLFASFIWEDLLL